MLSFFLAPGDNCCDDLEHTFLSEHNFNFERLPGRHNPDFPEGQYIGVDETESDVSVEPRKKILYADRRKATIPIHMSHGADEALGMFPSYESSDSSQRPICSSEQKLPSTASPHKVQAGNIPTLKSRSSTDPSVSNPSSLACTSEDSFAKPSSSAPTDMMGGGFACELPRRAQENVSTSTQSTMGTSLKTSQNDGQSQPVSLRGSKNRESSNDHPRNQSRAGSQDKYSCHTGFTARSADKRQTRSSMAERTYRRLHEMRLPRLPSQLQDPNSRVMREMRLAAPGIESFLYNEPGA